MLKHVRSNLLGYAALFVALSGVAYAAHTAPKNSVVSKSIKNGQVKGVDLAPKAVAGKGPIAVKPTTVAQFGDPNPCDVGVTGVFCAVWNSSASLTAGWANYGNGTAPVEYFKDAAGVVHISGTAAAIGGFPVAGLTYFVLPKPFRPANTHFFDVRCFKQSTYGFVNEETGSYRVDIGHDGAVTPSGLNDDSNCDYRPLDGISFHAG